MGPITTPQVDAVPVTVLELEESFDLAADGHHFDTKTCRRSRGGCREHREIGLTDDGPRYETKSGRRKRGSCRGGCRVRRKLLSNA
ncbi:hypothetical protein L484_001507 [Morus notabilis]|uniref:Uncharacterized protein n=1 Tax=Morus notabilis TaxID=981085 RepID=W9RTS4_9ROSA|nr:hypothetical protein L484_001507 [Morus notabilis]